MADINEEIKPDGFSSGKIRRNLVFVVIVVLLIAAVVGIVLQFSGMPSVAEKKAAKKQEEQRQEVSQMPAPRPEDLTAILGGVGDQPRTNAPVKSGANNRTEALFPDGANVVATATPGVVDHAITEADRLRATVAASGILALEADASASRAQQAQQPSPLDGLRDMLALQSAQAGGSAPDYEALVKAAQGGTPSKPSAQNVDWAKQAENATARGAVYVEPPMSPHTLYQGAVIPAVLVTTINSDLPGYITAQVTEDIFDSIHGRNRVIPKGARIVGTYNNEIADGQERLMAAFDRVILPNGASIQLKAMNGTDGQGRSGMSDEVDRHFWKRFGPPVLVSVLARLVTKSPSNVTVVNGGASSTGTASFSDATGQILVDTARQMLESGRDIRNSVIINQGYKFNILVNRDLVFQPEAMKGGAR